MSNGLELDLNLSSLFDGSNNGNFGTSSSLGNAVSSNFADYGVNMNMGITMNNAGSSAAADFLSLFESSASGSGGNGSPNTSSANSAGASAWHQKKALFDQLDQQQHHHHHQQQQLLEQNSLNALLSQHNPPNSVAGQASSQFQPSLFAELEQQSHNSAVASASSANNGNANSVNSHANSSSNYMFMATIMDPQQEDAPPQQMFFLPGSNQVIPMPQGNLNMGFNGASTGSGTSSSSAAVGNGQGGLMALANLPVVFNQPPSTAAATTGTSNSAVMASLLDRDSGWPAALQSLNAQASASNTSTLDNDLFQQVAAQGLAPLDLTNFGGLGSTDQHPYHPHPQLAANKAASAPAASAVCSPASQDSKASMPIRPLSAYNFFFSDERERILHNKGDEDDVFDSEKKQRLLLAHLSKDRTKRRPHRKTHGKINFTTLSKLIGQRWKQLPEDRKNFYREVAAIDLERYQRELRERSPQGSVEALCK